MDRVRCPIGKAVRLDIIVKELLVDNISMRQNIYDSVGRLWRQLLPPELLQHCSIDDISGGLLRVRVDSPIYAHELQLCSSELLKELQRRCPQARIQKIKTILV